MDNKPLNELKQVTFWAVLLQIIFFSSVFIAFSFIPACSEEIPSYMQGDVNISESKYHSIIADSIFIAEGGHKAQYLYGIRSIPYKDIKDARQICLNTIKNTLVKYRKSRCPNIQDDITCLAKRYAPIGADNDPNNLNKNWVKNVKFYLNKKLRSGS
jgi:hypothetical protein